MLIITGSFLYFLLMIKENLEIGEFPFSHLQIEVTISANQLYV